MSQVTDKKAVGDPPHQSEHAWRQLRRRILARRIPAGERLTEAHWASELGVNRGDVRLALTRLEAEGVVVRGRRGGFFTRQWTPHDIILADEARLALERGAARLVIERATDEDIAALAEIVEQMQLLADNDYELGLAEADVRFHAVMIRATHNVRLIDIYDRAAIPLTERLTPPASGEERRQWRQNDVAEHRRMLEAIRRRDLPGLIAELETGLRST